MQNTVKSFIFIFVTLFILFVSVKGQSNAATTLTNDGIKFPDGSIQTTKAVETGVPGLQGPKGDTGDTGPQGPSGTVAGSNKQIIYNDGGNAGGAEVYYDKSNSNVGIGTTTPIVKLHINSGGSSESLRLTSSGNDGTAITLNNTSSFGGFWIMSSTGATIGKRALLFRDETAAADRMIIDDNGNVGIGTTNPKEKLTVSNGNLVIANADNTDAYIYFNENSQDMLGIKYCGSCTGGAGNSFNIGRKIADAWFLTITEGGDVGIGTQTPSYKFEVNGVGAGTSWVNTSSRDYKKNIETIAETEYPMMLAKVMNMVPTRYEYKKEYGGDETTKLGFIAEDMPKEVLSKNGKAVDLYELLTLAIGAMKAQQKQIEDLKHQIEAFQSR